MPAILELPEVRARVLPVSVKGFEALVAMGKLGADVELVRGIVLNRTPKTPQHHKLTGWIFDQYGKQQLAAHVIFRGVPLRLADSMLEPDVTIVRGELDDFDTQFPTTAALIVEITASNEVLDREKASLYAEAGVDEYWIVLPLENQIEVYRQLENGVYRSKQMHSADETLTCESVPGLRVALAEWFA